MKAMFFRFERGGRRWGQRRRIHRRLPTFIQRRMVVRMTELVVRFLLQEFLQFEQRVKCRDDAPDNDGVNTEANIHARGFERDIRENRQRRNG